MMGVLMELELLEEAGGDAAGGGPGKPDLVVEDDGGVDGAAHHGGRDSVEVNLVGGGRVADGHPDVHESGELLEQDGDRLLEGDDGLHLDLLLLLVDVEHLDLVVVGLHLALAHTDKLGLVLLQLFACHISQFGILPNLVWRPGTYWLAIDVHRGLLPHVKPDDLLVLGIDLPTHLVEGGLKGRCSGLTTEVHLVSRDPSEVGDARDWVGQLLDLFEVVGHGHSLPYLRVVRHPAEVTWPGEPLGWTE